MNAVATNWKIGSFVAYTGHFIFLLFFQVLWDRRLLYVGPYISTVKPGQCPPVPPMLAGVLCRPSDQCKHDAQCEDILKCCFDGCSRTCQLPIATTGTAVFFTAAAQYHLLILSSTYQSNNFGGVFFTINYTIIIIIVIIITFLPQVV